MDLKPHVQQHWERETCGTRYGEAKDRAEWLQEIADKRYQLEPYIPGFARFESGRNKKVLEIGVGAGVDFLNWIEHGAHATGVDLTEAGIKITKERVDARGIAPEKYELMRADAEELSFEDKSFDIVYSWGVLHHTPNTEAAFREAFRVLKPGGTLRTMIYHVPSWTGWMLWTQYALLKGSPLKSARETIFNHLESPGTKAYNKNEARRMLSKIGYAPIKLSTQLCPGDLLNIKPSGKYQGRAYRAIWRYYPRRLVKFLGNRFGLNLMIEAQRPI